MFRKLTSEAIGSRNLVKSSVQRGIRGAIAAQYPSLSEELLEELLPKKQPMTTGKVEGQVTVVIRDNRVLFFQVRSGPWLPTLPVLHRYPNMMAHMQCDKGAIRFVLGGANIMCPGLTSPGGRMDDVPAETPVAIMAEGKEHAMAVGVTRMSTADIRRINKDVAVDVPHYLGDGLYLMDFDRA